MPLINFRAGKFPRINPQVYYACDQNEKKGVVSEFPFRDVDHDFHNQLGAQQADGHQ